MDGVSLPKKAELSAFEALRYHQQMSDQDNYTSSQTPTIQPLLSSSNLLFVALLGFLLLILNNWFEVDHLPPFYRISPLLVLWIDWMGNIVILLESIGWQVR